VGPGAGESNSVGWTPAMRSSEKMDGFWMGKNQVKMGEKSVNNHQKNLVVE
jgi:hypothetical protein